MANKKLSRGTVLGYVPVAAIAASSTTTDHIDPIHAAIERHRVAREALNDACGMTDPAEAGQTITAEDLAHYEKCVLEEGKTFAEFFLTTASTCEGRLAKIEYCDHYMDEWDSYRSALMEAANV